MFLNLRNKSEPFLEPILRKLRFDITRNDLKQILSKSSWILDYGCGPEFKFFRYLEKNKFPFYKYFGYDPLVKKEINKENIIVTKDFVKLKKYKLDVIVMFAVIEHLPYPKFDYDKVTSLLKKGGYLILTTPTKTAKYILEFFSYKLKIISEREIREHKHYFNLIEIEKLFAKYGLKMHTKKTFELGLNNYAVLRRG